MKFLYIYVCECACMLKKQSAFESFYVYIKFWVIFQTGGKKVKFVYREAWFRMPMFGFINLHTACFCFFSLDIVTEIGMEDEFQNWLFG